MLKTIMCYQGAYSGKNAHPSISLSDPLTDLTQEHRTAFLKKYVDMIGQLSKANHSLLWWATDISSKNRFFSPVLPFVEIFFKLMWLSEKAQEEVLICTDVPWEIFLSVQEALKKKGIRCSWHGNVWGIYWDILKVPFVGMGRIARHLAFIFPRITTAKKLFGPAIAKAKDDQTPVYAVKTFIASRSFDAQGKYKDAFFGVLPEFLSKEHRTIILGDITDDFSKTASLMHQEEAGRIYPLEAFLTKMDCLFAAIRMLFYNIDIPNSLTLGQYNACALMRQLCLTKGVKIQPLQFYQYFIMKRFVQGFNVSKFILTSEYNPWEKMCLWAVKQYSPQTKTIGYQHTVVPQASANMFTSHWEERVIPRPQRLLTVGATPKAIIHRYETCASSVIEAACGLRFEYLFDLPQSPRAKRGNILLALEGLPQVASLTDYALKELGHSGHHLRIRAHPLLPLSKFADQLSVDPAQIPGVTVSQGVALKEDLLWADIVIYWGSTVALEALAMGRPVIHFDLGTILSYDPLFELKDFKWVVGKPGELQKAIDAIYHLSVGEYDSLCQEAQKYIKGYFYKITPAALGQF